MSVYCILVVFEFLACLILFAVTESSASMLLLDTDFEENTNILPLFNWNANYIYGRTEELAVER